LSNANEIKMHQFFRGVDWAKLSKRQLKPPFRPNVSGIKDLKYFDKVKDPLMTVLLMKKFRCSPKRV